MKKFNVRFRELKAIYEKNHGLECFGNAGNKNGSKNKTRMTEEEYELYKESEAGSTDKD